MTRQEAYKNILARMQKDENRERYYNSVKHPTNDDQLLSNYLKKVRDSLDEINNDNDDADVEKSKTVFDIFIRKVIKILDEQGWE